MLLGYSPQRLAAINWVIAAVVAVFSAIVVGPLQGSLTPIGLSAPRRRRPRRRPHRRAALDHDRHASAASLLGAVQSLLQFWSVEGLVPRASSATGVRDAVPFLVIVARAVPPRQEPAAARHRRGETPAAVATTGARSCRTSSCGASSSSRPRSCFQDERLADRLRPRPHDVAGRRDHHAVDGRRHRLRRADLARPDVARRRRRLLHGADDGRRLDDEHQPVPGRAVRGSPGRSPARSGVVAAVVVGIVLGLPAVRIRGVQLAVVTLAFAISLQTLYLENQALTDLSAGAPANVRPATFFGINLASTGDGGQLDRPAFAIFVLRRARSSARSPWPTSGATGRAAGSSPCGPTSGRRRPPASTCRGPSCWPSPSPPGIAGIGGVMLGVQAERRVVGQLRLPVEHRVPRLRLPRRDHVDQRRDHRRHARAGRA